jgi:hypothetical protein
MAAQGREGRSAEAMKASIMEALSSVHRFMEGGCGDGPEERGGEMVGGGRRRGKCSLRLVGRGQIRKHPFPSGPCSDRWQSSNFGDVLFGGANR